MRHYSKHLFALIAALICPVVTIAGPCDAYFSFDGDLQDAGGNSYNGQMIGKEGAKASPQFAEGKYGQALHLDGTSAMRSFIDLHLDTCPQVTVTAWIQATGTVRKGVQYLFSTGSGSGPGIRVSGTNLTLSGSANGITQRNAIRANAGWMFVAGVYDYTKGTYTLYSRTRGVDKELGENIRAPEEAIWVGAFNDGLAGPATDILIDDLHIYGRALRREEIRKLQIGETEKNLVASDPSLPMQPEGPSFGSPMEPPNIPGGVLTQRPPVPEWPPSLVGGNTPINNAIYSVCQAAGDCTSAGNSCFDISVPAESTDGSMCSRTCSADSQCGSSNGFNGACYSLGGSTATCFQRCEQTPDCNSGTQCISVTLPGGTLDGVCVPNRPEIIEKDAVSCSSDNQCEPSNGFTGACYSLGGATASCYQRCDRDDDCNSGIQCISVTLPAGTLDGV